MITRLEVDGFKSLRGFAIDLEPFTVLIGPNGAGKSNVLEAIGLLSRLWEGAADALKAGRGRASDQFSRYRSESVRDIRFGVETLEPDTDDQGEDGFTNWAVRSRYEVSLAKTAATGGVEHVKLTHRAHHLASTTDAWLAAHPEWSERVIASSDERELGYMPSFGFVEFHAANLRESSDRIDSGELLPDGSNLPTVLASLADDSLGEIRAELAALVPGVANFAVVESDDAYRIEFHMRDGDVVPARLISNGTLRVLALLTAVYSQRAWSSILCIEEPENGIYPGRLRRLIDLLREVTDLDAWREERSDRLPPQVIVTTHSPVFLAALREHPQHLRYIDTVQRGGIRVTRARPVGERASAQEGQTIASLAEISAILEDASLSEVDR
ncbi:AAA family ATPase [Nannocystis pusilla]|uniref:AAA family ATPase n=1 Tax=Nannocystis pusilla TaxID=889268 RepID=A0ABS7U0R4_9BACT|nr:ATP-binding protein [Nannocystis pusilla]MBZ5714039.1 AAA family ATPase [Nannocystis pusilla]